MQSKRDGRWHAKWRRRRLSGGVRCVLLYKSVYVGKVRKLQPTFCNLVSYLVCYFRYNTIRARSFNFPFVYQYSWSSAQIFMRACWILARRELIKSMEWIERENLFLDDAFLMIFWQERHTRKRAGESKKKNSPMKILQRLEDWYCVLFLNKGS